MSFIEKLNMTAYDALKQYKVVNAGGVSDFVVATDGKIYKSIVDSKDKEPSANPTEWLELVFGTQVGGLMAWPDTSVPAGWLVTEGGSFDTTTYAGLFNVIGYKYGGAGASFNVPDYRGQFLRGFDNGAGVDPDSGSRTDRGDGTTGDNVGTKELDAFQAFQIGAVEDATGARNTYGLAGNRDQNPTQSAGANAALPQLLTTAQGVAAMWKPVNDGTNGDPRTSSETRPANVYVQHLIKFN